MKKAFAIGFFMILLSGIHGNLHAQSEEAQQLLLNVEKLAQLKSILNNLYKGYEIVNKGYNTIKDLSEGNFSLHKQFLDGLLSVSPVVGKYKRVGDIVATQVTIVKEYKRAFARFKSNNHFTATEIKYLADVYSRLFDQSLEDVEALATIITADKLRMSDDERLQAIDKLYADITEKLVFVRQFNSKIQVLAIQRAKEQNDVNTIRNIYGIK
ncbi:TerB family tellurite resistance protein [Segetibacter sp. 3557_3]|uniref:TerB family tellurite resistance protein n=1 Tax=Segetibacter sp. 3557_3 TaxID=2547429 RepID=UPI001058BC83|nr:TerB family tellurite resistance protein [Segetibacter sp. 3557_3]TDH18155.1 TerB family tellurite resistance protein [Segetibacter sp. 3557_3]